MHHTQSLSGTSLSVELSWARSVTVVLDPLATEVTLVAVSDGPEDYAHLLCSTTDGVVHVRQTQPHGHLDRSTFSATVVIQGLRVFGNISGGNVAGGCISAGNVVGGHTATGAVDTPTLELTLTMPATGAITLDLAGAVQGYILHDVYAPLTVELSGGAHLHADRVVDCALELSGSAQAAFCKISGRFSCEMSGAAQLLIADITTAYASIDASGRAQVQITQGDQQCLSIHASGAADLCVGGRVDRLDVHASGASKISLARVLGPIQRRTSGASSLHIGTIS